MVLYSRFFFVFVAKFLLKIVRFSGAATNWHLYVTFKYRATDGKKTTNQALVKIQIFCACRSTAPDVTVCPGTKITPKLLIAEGALFTGCRDVMLKFDLRKIPAHPAAGACCPYTLSCLGCALVKGSVCFLRFVHDYYNALHSLL